MEAEFKFHLKDVVVSSTFVSRTATRAPRRAYMQANGGIAVIYHKSIYKNSKVWREGALVLNAWPRIRYYRVFTSPIIPCFFVDMHLLASFRNK